MNIPLRWHPGWLASLLILIGASPAEAEIVNYLLPAADTTLRENLPDNNFGAAASLQVGVSGNGTPRNRGLFRFDLSRLPADAVLNSVKLRFTVTQAGPLSPPTAFEVRRVLTNWNEGGKSGLAATFGEATWTARSYQQSAWGEYGGLVGTDFASGASGTGILTSAGVTTEFSSANLMADVLQWKTNGGVNFGWVLMAQGEPAGSGKQVGSREHSSSGPILELRYSSYSIYDAYRVGNALRFSFDVSSNQTYAVESRDAVNSGTWTTLTNIPAFAADATIHITNQLVPTPRFYRLRKP